MRSLLIKQDTDGNALLERLATSGTDKQQTLARLQALNPHLDFTKRIAVGAVLLLPDQTGLRASESDSIAGDAFDALAAQLTDALAASLADVRSGHADRAAAQKDVTSVLNSTAVKRLLDGDQDLAKQAAAALAAAKDDAAAAKQSDAAMATLQKEAAAELAGLGKMLSG